MPALRSKTLVQASFWLAAILVSCAGVVFDKAVHFIQEFYLTFFQLYPVETSLLSPLCFIGATWIVIRFAPKAGGSGIPQAMKATRLSLGHHHTAMQSGLISVKTAVVKVASTLLGLLGGASIGREGPTVQISTALFAWIGAKTKKIFPYVNFHSYLVAGSAAGVSAAFNTPLAGISFALEEMAEGSFSQTKHSVMVSVILAGITTQTLVGNYVYFGTPRIESTELLIIIPAISIGLLGGLLGGLFAHSLAHPIWGNHRWQWWHRALLCGVLVALINWISIGKSAGTGYEITKAFMDSPQGELSWDFPLTKIVTSILSFLSGMAGGIFSPSLAIGAGIGASFSDLLGFADPKACALLGMVAFFSGVVQAPLTAVIIVMEMTDLHPLIIPLMIAAFVGQGVSKLIMPTSLYHYLSRHRY